MFNRDIFIIHLLRFFLSPYQCTVQVITYINLAAGYLDKLLNKLRRLYLKSFMINSHLRQQSVDQAVFLGQQAQKQMFLFNLLIPVLISQFLTILHCLQGLLCKFI